MKRDILKEMYEAQTPQARLHAAICGGSIDRLELSSSESALTETRVKNEKPLPDSAHQVLFEALTNDHVSVPTDAHARLRRALFGGRP